MHLKSLPGLDDFGLISGLMKGMLAPSTTPGGMPGGGTGASATVISTSVSTQVSPQISPVFVQQSSPSNSPIGAAPLMGTPVTGAIPNIDRASGWLPTGIPAIPSIPISANAPLLYGAFGLLALALILKARKNKAPASKGKRR